MTNSWKKNRNYRRYRLKDGTVKNIITVDVDKVEVTDEVYKAYSQMDRRERYLEELDSREMILSIDKMIEDGVSPDKYDRECCPSAEDEVMAEIDAAEHEEMLAALPSAMEILTEAEREMIQAIYLDGVSLREYARQLNTPTMSLHYRLKQIHAKLRKFF